MFGQSLSFLPGSETRGRELLWNPHFQEQVCVCVCVCVCALSCVQLCDPVEGSPPGSSVYGISQIRILEWVAISSSRGSS